MLKIILFKWKKCALCMNTEKLRECFICIGITSFQFQRDLKRKIESFMELKINSGRYK